ncbi:MAG: LOG family protein [Planctomycetia bacterium]|nr:MAG: LOG family protein [Planctomycetia bacterium]
MRRAFTVTVFGRSSARKRSPEFRIAADLGAAIARNGWTLCNGGYGGTMSAAAQAAAAATIAGGTVMGITVSAFRRARPNPFNTRLRPAADVFDRIRALIEFADAFVVLPGEIGTLLELAAALLRVGRRRRARPIILIGDYWKPVCERVRGHRTAEPIVVADVEGAIAAIQEHIAKRNIRSHSTRSTTIY